MKACRASYQTDAMVAKNRSGVRTCPRNPVALSCGERPYASARTRQAVTAICNQVFLQKLGQITFGH